MDAALHEQRAASALRSDACSRPSTSTSSSSLASFGRSRGLATTCSQTYSRLGYVSPSYADKHATSHGIIGMSGYLSVPHLTLAPTIPNGLGERVLAAEAAARPGNGQQRPKPRGASSSARQYRRLGQKDLQYLKDNEERNQQVFQQWLKLKAQEKLKGQGTAEDQERRRKEELERYLEKEQELKKQAAAAVSEWQAKKSAEAQLQAMHRAAVLRRDRPATCSTRVRAASAQAINKEREDRFTLLTWPHTMQQACVHKVTLDSTKPAHYCASSYRPGH